MVVGYTAGVWDLLHRGHLNILYETRKLCDILVVGVVTDDGTAAYKARPPVDPEWKRIHQIRSIPWVDVAVLQDSTDPTPELERFRPDVFTHGSDWDRLKQGHDTIDRLGIKYVSIPYTEGISTTMLRGLS
jgi:glycerol-3-phosphate cytidylyltransferase